MLHPAPTTEISPTLSRGTLTGIVQATDSSPAQVVLEFANTSYQMHLELTADLEPMQALIGQTILGTIHGIARRIDVASAGGQLVDPCIGMPRRVHGTVLGIDPRANAIVINAGGHIAFWLELSDPSQKAEDFASAGVVMCDLLPDSWFTFKSKA